MNKIFALSAALLVSWGVVALAADAVKPVPQDSVKAVPQDSVKPVPQVSVKPMPQASVKAASQMAIHPRVGVMSERVLRAKLANYGVTNVSSIQRTASGYTIVATVNGKQTQLQLDGKTNTLLDSAGVRLPAAMARKDMIVPARADKLQRAKELGVAPVAE